MTCDFLKDKNCLHPESGYFLSPIISNIKELHGDSEVGINMAEVVYKCKGQDNCEVYKAFQLLKKQTAEKE